MKRVIVILMILFNLLNANKVSLVDKIVNLYNIKTNGIFDFNATKSGDGYDITVSPSDPFYSEILNHKFMHISVDEGPIVTTPKFTFAKAGLSAKGSVFDFFKPEVVKELKKSIKQDGSYRYSGTISFGDEFKEEMHVDPMSLQDANFSIAVSELLLKSTTDLETLKGDGSITLNSFSIKDGKEKSALSLYGLSITNIITEKPIENLLLFGKTSMHIDRIELNATTPRKIAAKLVVDADSEVKRVNSIFLDANAKVAFKALDAETIMLLAGFKSGKFEFVLKNLGIQGVLEMIKLSKKMQKINNKMMQESKSGNDIEIQKAIIESNELMNQLIPVINHMFIKEKTKLVFDWQMQSEKLNYIKFDFTYMGEPLQGSNLQGAMISLMAQQLTLLDGSFDIALERDLIEKINPLSILFLDMLKQKGFITEKNSIYHLKGELKGGKIVINGKAYTIEELTRVLFN